MSTCDTDALLLVPPFGRRLADAPQEPARGAFTEVVKALLQFLDGRFRIGVRGEEVVKGAVLRDELQHHVGVLDGRLDIAPVADYGRVLLDGSDLLRT